MRLNDIMMPNSMFKHFNLKDLWQLESVCGIVNVSKNIRFPTTEHMFIILFEEGDAITFNTEEETIAYLKALLKLSAVA